MRKRSGRSRRIKTKESGKENEEEGYVEVG